MQMYVVWKEIYKINCHPQSILTDVRGGLDIVYATQGIF